MDKDEKIRDELRRRQTGQMKGRIGGRHNPDAGVIDVVNQVDAVPEDHLYLVSETPDGGGLLWEADLLGDRTKDEGYGELPPMIHIYCPFCSTARDQRAISITPPNKTYMIEDRSNNPIVLQDVMLMDGSKGRFEIYYALSVNEEIQCPYGENVEGERCGAKFVIKDAHIQKVG